MSAGGTQVGESSFPLKEFERLITQEMVDLYAIASGDRNPVHLDEEFASGTRFGTRIAHGMLSLALVSELFEINFSDAWRCGGAVMKAQFRSPIFPGETVRLYCSVEQVSEGNDGRRVLFVKGFCTKPDGKDAVTAQAKIPFLESPNIG